MVKPQRKSSQSQFWAVVVSGMFVLGFLLNADFPLRSFPNTVEAHPGDNLQQLVDSHPPGTSFELEPGVYRMQSVVPKDGDTFSGEQGAVLDGAQLLSNFTQQGNYWTARTQAQQLPQYRGKCLEDRAACIYPEDAFMDDSPLLRVADLSEMGPGKWYLDYATGQAYLADNPTGHKIEMSVVPHAFSGSAQKVTIQGLTIEKYACMAGEGAIQSKKASGPPPGKNWIVQNNLVQYNHGVGIWAGPGMQVISNRVLHNGQMGLAGSGVNILIQGNEVAFNNDAGYYYPWEAGGSKFVFTTNLVVRNNFVHDNKGPGLWTDIENTGALYDGNRMTRNQGAGIQHEVSYQAVIRNNVIDHDGFSPFPGQTSPWYGAGIVVAGSSDVEVYGNTVTDCMNGIIGRYPRRELSHEGTPYVLRNLYVHDNTITQSQGVAAGIIRSGGMSDDVFSTWNNRFVNNTFHILSAGNQAFAWQNALMPLVRWHLDFHEN